MNEDQTKSEKTLFKFGNSEYEIESISRLHYVDFEVVEMPEKEKVLTGSVKWDGCSNWNLGAGMYMHHACTKSELGKFSAILMKCWEIAAKTLPTFQGEEAD